MTAALISSPLLFNLRRHQRWTVINLSSPEFERRSASRVVDLLVATRMLPISFRSILQNRSLRPPGKTTPLPPPPSWSSTHQSVTSEESTGNHQSVASGVEPTDRSRTHCSHPLFSRSLTLALSQFYRSPLSPVHWLSIPSVSVSIAFVSFQGQVIIMRSFKFNGQTNSGNHRIRRLLD